MTTTIEYKKSVAKDLKKIDKSQRIRVMDMIEEKLSENPNLGDLAKGKFKGCRKARIGDYRVVYRKKKDSIEILRIRHRKYAYRIATF